MAVIKAAATGNWSATGTWSGGVVPTLNDTVYANGFTVTLDQSIDLTGSTVDTSGSFIAGQIYQIVSVGTTNFALTANCIAPGTNAGTAVAITSAVGQIFQAVNAGTATTGTARRMGALLNYVNTPLTIATGGGFTLAANWNITGAYIQAGSANCLTVSAAASSTLVGCRATGSAFTLSTRAIAFSSSGTLTLNGIVAIGGRVAGTTGADGAHAIESTSAAGTVAITNASTITGGSGNTDFGMNNASTGTVTVSSSTISAGVGGNCDGIANNSTGTITVSSSTVTGGSTSGGADGISNNSTGTVTVSSSTITGGGQLLCNGIANNSTGTVTVSSSTITGGSYLNAYGIYNASTGPVTITGDVTASTGAGVINNSTGTVIINGTLTPTTSVHALQCTNTTGANITLSGSLIYASNGFAPTNCLKFLVNPTPTAAFVRFAKNGSTTYSEFYTADNNLGQAAITDVRFGTVYASGALTGVAYIPSASSVAFGVPTDNTTGTATLTAANVRAALGLASANMDTQLAVLSNLDTTVSSRLAPSGTLATVTTLTNAPASVTPAQIRAEMDSNSTKLANLDATVSSRLASSAYSAAPTTAQIATAVEGSLLNEADGQAVLNAIVGAIGNTNVSDVALVAAIRADLERTGGKLDSIPTTAAPTAAANATAVWATATKEITGGTVDTLTNSPSVPSAASIASATRTELATELGRLDAAVSTRLATSGYTAPSTAPTVAAIRAEMDANSTKLANLDATVSSRLAPSGTLAIVTTLTNSPNVPSAAAIASQVRAELTSELSKVAALNTERLANVATTAIVGNLIAQANS